MLKNSIRFCLVLQVLSLFLIPTSLSAQNSSATPPHKSGVIELPETEKERILERFEAWEAPSSRTRSELPDQIINSAYLPKVSSQGSLGICATFAVYYYLQSYYFAKARGLTERADPATTPQFVFSPAWGVLMAPHGYIGDKPEGSAPLACIESILNLGVLTWQDMPYSDQSEVASEDKFYRQLPTAIQMKDALHFKGMRGSTLNGIDTPDGLQNLKFFLSEGNIAVAIWNAPLTTNFDSYPLSTESVEIAGLGTVANVNNNVYAWTSEEIGRNPSHAVTIVGYDDTIEYRNKNGELCQGALLLVNSWGTTWGISPAAGLEAGFMWLGYDVVLQSKKLQGQVYSIAARSEDYQPSLLGTFEFQDLTNNNWKTTIMGYDVRWPSLLKTTANGVPLAVNFTSNIFITKSNTAQPDLDEYVFDFSNLEGNLFPALTLQTSLITPDAVGKITGLDIEHRVQDEEQHWIISSSGVPDVDFTVQRFSSSYPTFTATIAMLQNKEINFQDLHPQAGSSAWGDANGDGYPDLAIAVIQKKDNATLEILHRVYLNNKNGGFLEPSLTLPIPTSEYLRSELAELLWVDIDNDGDLDLVAGNGDATYIFSNNGQGAFNRTATLPYSSGSCAIVSADFDLDGRPDLALAGTNTSGTQILFQTNTGNFNAFRISSRNSNNVGLGIYATTMAVGDINGDSLPDLVASGRISGSNQELIWYQNNGDYTFTPRQLPLPSLPNFSIAIADFNADGCDDILYSAGNNNGTHNNGVFCGKTEGLPQPAAMPSTLPPLWGGKVLWVDLNNDGQLEAVISGIENNGLNSNSAYGYGELGQYPREQFYKNYTRVLLWNASQQQFQDSGMQLPGTVGFDGSSLLSAVDFDKDGDVDLLCGGVLTSKANFYSGQGPDTSICSILFLENRAGNYFENKCLNTPPATPDGLIALAQGSGKVEFNWTASADDSTPQGSLRYLLQAGTTSGQYNLSSGNTPDGLPGQWLKPPVTMRLPAGKIYWRVRAVDASGQMSEWSNEMSVTATGSETVPAPGDPLPEISPPDVTVIVQSLDSNGTTAGGYVLGGGVSTSGSTMLLKAFPRAGWRFSHWEGDVYSPLARKTKMLAQGNVTVIAYFVPDYEILRTAATHSALRDRAGRIWAWNAENALAKTGPAWCQALDGLPALASASNASCLELNDTRTFYGVKKGEYDSTADNNKNFLRDSLMTIHALDDFQWWPYPTYPEKTLNFWCNNNSYIANHIGTYTMEYDEITFGGSAQTLYPYTTWTVSQHDPNQINLGIAQVACTDSFVLFLTHQAGIYAIGSNRCGQLGDNTTNTYTTITSIPGMPKFKTIAAGWDSSSQTAFALGLDFQGRVWSWGNNDYGQLGLGYHASNTNVMTPQILPPFSSPVTALAAGNRHVLVLTEDGQVFAWGDNSQGQVGSGDADGDGILDQTIASTPYPIPGLAPVISIAAAAFHSLALTEDDQLFGWGNNGSGQISGTASPAFWAPTPVLNAPKYTGAASTLTSAVRSSADEPGSNITYPGMGSVIPPAGLYAARTGSTLQIQAIDGERYLFSHWEGPVADPDSPITTVLIGTNNTQVCAIFQQVGELMLTITANPETGGTTLPALGTYTKNQGSNESFCALPNPQFNFTGWETPTLLGEKAQQSEFSWEMTADLSLTAKFAVRAFQTTAKPNIGGNTLSLTESGQIVWWTQKTGGSSGYTYTLHTVDFAGVRALDVVGDGLALGNNGRLYAWGSNNYGEHGNGTSSSTYTYPDNYSVVLGPDGADFFTDAVRIFSCSQTRFAQRADGSLYIWGKTPITDQAQTRPIRINGLKENTRVLEIIEATGDHSTFFFLYDDGTVASWGDADFTGTGIFHATPMAIPNLTGICRIAAGAGVVLALHENGTVYVWGKSGSALGLGENPGTQETPILLPNLSNINRIFVINGSCFAVNQQGKLYIWGQNGSWWWLGVGMDGPEAYYTPTLHPNVNLPEFVSISGGSSHIVALTTSGQLWKWGRNANEYNPSQSQQLSWPNAVRDTTFGTLSLTSFSHHRVALSFDPRAAGLVNYPEGVYTLLEGDTITLYANSAPGLNFQAWRKDDNLLSVNPFLELQVNESFDLQAEYQIASPVLQLADISVDAGSLAAIPLYFSEGYSSYEAFDLIVCFPDTLRFRGLDREETQLDETAMISYWSMPNNDPSNSEAKIRLTVQQMEPFFSAGETPLAKLLFELPWDGSSNYPITIDVSATAPALSRQHGAFADTAISYSAQINILPGTVQEFQCGWLSFTPFGELPYSSLTAWADALANNGIILNPVAWYWNPSSNRWQTSSELLPNQPYMIYVETSGFSQLELEPAPFATTLKPGWNLLTVPVERLAPANATVIFTIADKCYQKQRTQTLKPGITYWIFWEHEQTVF